MAEHITEDVIVQIQERLPIKSLICFTSVLKRWRSIILSDPKFAKSQFQMASQRQTIRHRVIISTPNEPEFESRDLAAPSSSSSSSFGDNSSVRKLRCPSNRPGYLSATGDYKVLAELEYHGEKEDLADIVAFDLAKEEFRRMPLPVLDYQFDEEHLVHLGASFRGTCVYLVVGILMMLALLIRGS